MSVLRITALVMSTLSISFPVSAADSNPVQVMSEGSNMVLALAKLYNNAQGKMLTNGNASNFGLMACYQIDMLNLQVISSNMTLTTTLMALVMNTSDPTMRQQTSEILVGASANLKVSAMSALATVKMQSDNPLCMDAELQGINRQADATLSGIVAVFDTLPNRP